MSEDVAFGSEKPSLVVEHWNRLKFVFQDTLEAQSEALQDYESHKSHIHQLVRQIESLRAERSTLTELCGRQQKFLEQFTDLQREKEVCSIRISELEYELSSKNEELSVIAVEREFDLQNLRSQTAQDLETARIYAERENNELRKGFNDKIQRLQSEHESKRAFDSAKWESLLQSKERDIQRITQSYESKFVILESEVLSLKESLRKHESSPRTTSDIERSYKKRLNDMRTYYESRFSMNSNTSETPLKEKKKISFCIPGEAPNSNKFKFKRISETNPSPKSLLKETPKKRKLFNPSQDIYEQ